MREETLLVPKFKIVAGTPAIILSDTGQGADLKKWSMDLSGGNFRLRTLNDNESELASPLQITRSGDITINTYLKIGTVPPATHYILSIRNYGQSGFEYNQFGGSWRTALQLIGTDDTTDFLHIIAPQVSPSPEYNHTLFLSNHGFDFRPQASHNEAGNYAFRINDDGKIILNGQTASYFYNPYGTNDLAFVTNNNETLRLQNGNVGIATAPTNEKLTVGGSIKLVGSNVVIFNSGASLELRAGDGSSIGYDINIGYGNYNGAKLTFWGGSTSVKMEVSTAGAVKFASYVSAGTAFRINDGVGSAGQFLRSDGSTGFVANTIQSTDLPADLTFTNLLVTGIIRNPGASLDLRAGNGTTGQDIVLGYGTGYGNNLIFYGGSTSVKFQIATDGAVTFSGNVGIATAPTIEKLTVGGSIKLTYPGSGPTAVIFSSNQTLELRAGDGVSIGYDINIGYGNYNGLNLNFWGGSTSLKMQVSSAGVGWFASACSATYFQPTSGYKSVDGSVGIDGSFTIGPNQYTIKNGLITNIEEV